MKPSQGFYPHDMSRKPKGGRYYPVLPRGDLEPDTSGGYCPIGGDK